MIAWLSLALAAPPPGPADVLQEVRDGVVVNWTSHAVVATTEAHGRGVEGTTKATEHDARRRLPRSIEVGALAVPVTAELDVRTLVEDPILGEAVAGRIERWQVAESRYFASGRVQLVGTLPLAELLKPWTLSVVEPLPSAQVQPRWTGLVVDARGLPASPAYAPTLRAGDEVLFDGHLWEGTSLDTAPVTWVTDPAHPAAAVAGEEPLVLLAEAATGAVLTLSEADAIRFRTGLQGALFLGEGGVVVVVDP